MLESLKELKSYGIYVLISGIVFTLFFGWVISLGIIGLTGLHGKANMYLFVNSFLIIFIGSMGTIEGVNNIRKGIKVIKLSKQVESMPDSDSMN